MSCCECNECGHNDPDCNCTCHKQHVTGVGFIPIRQTCKFCKFYISCDGWGHCHKHAPIVTEDKHRSGFPVTYDTDFCGDWEKQKAE